MNCRRTAKIVLAFALALAGVRPAATGYAAAQPIVIRLAHSYSTTSMRHLSAEKFKEMLESRTGGRVRLEILPAGQLYSDERQALQAAIQGNVEMATPPLSNVTAYDPAFFVFDLPFLFKDQDSLNRFEDSPVGTDLLKRVEKIGLKGLSYWDAGGAVVVTKSKVTDMSQLKGLKIRVPAGRIQVLSFKPFGASGVSLGVGEIPSAMQNNLIDGVYTDTLNSLSARLNEVAGYMFVTNQQFFTPGLVMNLKFYEGLPQDIRDTITAILPEWLTFQRALSRKQQADAVAELARKGMAVTRLTPEQITAARTANREAYEEGRKLIGDSLYKQVIEWK